MTPERLASLPEWGVSFDTETHMRQPGLEAPPLVCGSLAQLVSPEGWAAGMPHAGISGELLDKERALEAFVALLEDEQRVIIGAHIAYDMLVCATEWAKRGRDVLPLIFRAYEQGRVYDVLIGQALGAIADGTLGVDPRTGGDLRDPITNEPKKYYSLAIVTDLLSGRKDAKVNDEWRLKYALLDGIPIEEWPVAARTYPVDDVRNTHEDALMQAGHLPKMIRHRWRTISDDQGERTVCSECGVDLMTAHEAGTQTACWVVRPHRNLHQMADQAYTAWVLHLGAAWGFATDQEAVTEVLDEVLATRKEASTPLVEVGLLRWERKKGEQVLTKNKAKVARTAAAAYGASGECSHCHGTSKMVSKSKKAPTRRAWDPEKDGINCVECAATGFDLDTAPGLRLTAPSKTYPRGQVECGADPLFESGAEILIDLAEYEEHAKTVTNYVPYLRLGCIERKMAGGVVVRYPRPLTLRPNVLLETDRVSYGDAIQQFPRDGGLRACIVARRGFVLVSCDYNQGEVITHAQSCLWILGKSRQAQILLQGKEPHSMFGAAVLGVPYEVFFAQKKKVKAYTNARQAAKPWIFGKPGGMGAAKLVLTQRRQGPDTPCEGGPVWIDSEEKDPATGKPKKIRGFRGLRFCILMDGADYCGRPDDIVREWGKGDYVREIKPTCRRCLECAERLQKAYFDEFPEARPYFKFTSDVAENGQLLTTRQCRIFGLPPGSRLSPGEMVQHVSNIIRGGVTYTDCSNGYFQSLLAVASKRALRIAQRECCDSTARVPEDACLGGDVSKYAGQRSPLYGSRCIVLQHDEIIAELREETAHHAAMRLSEIMVRCLQEVCPDMAAVCKAPPALMRRWLKAAEPRYRDSGGDKPANDNDVLVPWDDVGKKAA